jgi:hypothetical protein
MRWQVNHKRVYRLYCEEGLAMRRKAKKRLRSEGRTPLDLRGERCLSSSNAGRVLLSSRSRQRSQQE